MTECVIQQSMLCFKYLLINGIGDPSKIMIELEKMSQTSEHRYEWDCMGVAIYYGEMEIMKILEEKGVEKGKNPEHMEAAILSYRNEIVKEIIKKIKDMDGKIKDKILMNGLKASGKSNNIKGAELLIQNGANINAKVRIYHYIEI